MALSREFSERDWRVAPRYQSPESAPGSVIALDFRKFRDIARSERERGAFRVSDDGTIAKTPLYVDDLPAAIYVVDAQYPDFTPNHNTADPETLVVLDGALVVVPNDGSERDEHVGTGNIICKGEVAEFYDEAISMQATKMMNPLDLSPARCLALALYRDDDLVIRVNNT